MHFDHTWEDIIGPLGMLKWGREGAREIVVEIQDQRKGNGDPEGNTERRTSVCKTYEELEIGLEKAIWDGKQRVYIGAF